MNDHLHPMFARLCDDMGALGLLPSDAAPIYDGPSPINPADLPPIVLPVDQCTGD